jgi:hypothetical protein
VVTVRSVYNKGSATTTVDCNTYSLTSAQNRPIRLYIFAPPTFVEFSDLRWRFLASPTKLSRGVAERATEGSRACCLAPTRYRLTAARANRGLLRCAVR